MVMRVLCKGVHYLWFVTSINTVTGVDINISSVLSRFIVVSI
jgi:hypothetical protein